MLQNEKENYAVTRIRTWVASATTKSTNHYTITATRLLLINSSKVYNRFWLYSDTFTSIYRLSILRRFPLSQLSYVLLVKWEPVSHFGYTQRVQWINIDIFPYKKGEPELSVCRKVTRETANSFPVSHPLNPLHSLPKWGIIFEICSKSQK